ncbi:MAG: Aminodeoxychorismate lyase [Candidatus Giovannonibacteria bacterium GW2011_GWA1_43_15]|nr:MAG: Aminodeoxychorismate lyase [Candidatus Giovannonibacteria bacterium GW2011_GWA1_43_15]
MHLFLWYQIKMNESQEIKKLFTIAGVLILALLVFYVLIKLPGYIKRKTMEKAVAGEVAITIPEGLNAGQIGEILERAGLFSKSAFSKAAQKEEGFLFPDTYRFYKTSKPEQVAARMRENFDKKITPEILDEIKKQNKTLRDVIIMASLLEEEVQSTADRKLAAGILWKRLKLGMGLQVDSAPDTYRYRGLPPGPISNPGLDAILAATHPEPSPYLYYLSGQDGKTHYAKTLEEHALNKYKYLKKND